MLGPDIKNHLLNPHAICTVSRTHYIAITAREDEHKALESWTDSDVDEIVEKRVSKACDRSSSPAQSAPRRYLRVI